MDLSSERTILVATYTCLATVAGYAALLLMRRKKNVRRYKVRPLNRQRHTTGHFYTLVKDMQSLEVDLEQYCKYTRMTPNLFQYLLDIVGPSLQKDQKKYHLSPSHRLMMTLHYLSAGISMQEIAWNYRVGKTTAHVIIHETCEALWTLLAPQQLSPPSTNKWIAIADGFFKRWNMPNCLGAVDGKHVAIQSPKLSGSTFFNYKKHFSIVLMASCDAYYRFVLIDIGAAGSMHDSIVFQESGFGHALLRGSLPLPGPKHLPRTTTQIEHFFVADQAFPLHKHIMRPYPGTNLGETKTIFNYRLSRARRTIENSFGILVHRWRILLGPIRANVETCEKIVKAARVLHNFIQKAEADMPLSERKYCPTGFVDHIDDETGTIIPGTWRDDTPNLRPVRHLGSNNSARSVQSMRDNLADYFVSDVGCVPWQWNHVLRGSVPV